MEDAFMRHIGRASDHVPRVALGHLVVADVAAFHPSALKLVKHGRDFRRAGCGIELEGEEYVRAVGGVVPVYKFGDGTRVYDRM
jgi:hypothetical protein